MAFKRKSSQVIADAQQRIANLKAIDPNLDLGNDLTVADYESRIAASQQQLDTYNAQLAKADAAGNDFRSGEKSCAACQHGCLRRSGASTARTATSMKWRAAPAAVKSSGKRSRKSRLSEVGFLSAMQWRLSGSSKPQSSCSTT